MDELERRLGRARSSLTRELDGVEIPELTGGKPVGSSRRAARSYVPLAAAAALIGLLTVGAFVVARPVDDVVLTETAATTPTTIVDTTPPTVVDTTPTTIVEHDTADRRRLVASRSATCGSDRTPRERQRSTTADGRRGRRSGRDVRRAGLRHHAHTPHGDSRRGGGCTSFVDGPGVQRRRLPAPALPHPCRGARPRGRRRPHRRGPGNARPLRCHRHRRHTHGTRPTPTCSATSTPSAQKSLRSRWVGTS